MIKTDFISLYEELNSLNEATVDNAKLMQEIIDALKAAGRDDLVTKLADKELVDIKVMHNDPATKAMDDIIKGWN